MPIGRFAVAKVLLLVAGLAISPLVFACTPLQPEHHSSSTPRLNKTVLGELDIFSSSPDEVARKGLEDVRRLEPKPTKSEKVKTEDDEYAKALGFTSAQEAGRATLGLPFTVFMSRLSSLKHFSFGSDLEGFMVNTHNLIYPLLVDGKPKSSLTVTMDRKSHRWRTTEWGSPKLTELLEGARGMQPRSSLVVLISPQNPLGLRFIGERKAGELLLTPIADIPKLGLTAKQQRPAREIFLSLVPMANKYTDAQLEGLKGRLPTP
jgi:hypothetical protein